MTICKHLQIKIVTILLLIGVTDQSFSQTTKKEENYTKLEQANVVVQQLHDYLKSAYLQDSIAQNVLQLEVNSLKPNPNQSKKREKLEILIDSIAKTYKNKEQITFSSVDSIRKTVVGVPVVLFNDTIFHIYAKLGPYSASDRATHITNKIELLVEDKLFDKNSLLVVKSHDSYDILHADLILFSVTDKDAFWMTQNPETLANNYKDAVIESIEKYNEYSGLLGLAKQIGLVVIVIALFYFSIRYMNKGFTKFNRWILQWGKQYLTGITFKNYEFLTQEKELQLLKFLLKVTKWFLIIFIIYLALPILFSIFPATKGVATMLFGYIWNPVTSFVGAFISYLPSLIAVIVIMVATFYFVRFLHFLTTEVQSEKLKLPGFYPDWAIPTFNILKVIIYAFSFIIIFPYLPGSDSPIFQGVSVFFGLLISLGSSSAISNIIAGLVITYMRAFKIGDRVKIGDTTGDVIEKTLLVTRLRTIKNEEITIPNSSILNGSTINYTTSANSLGLILHTTVTIGYDVPWRQVHQLLIDAANKTEFIKKDPAPFVLQTSLDDFYVSYQINAYTDQADKAAKIYSQLYSNIQDCFNEGGVEILSPHYRAARDGNMVTIPANYLPKDYKAPHFKVKVDNT